VTDFEEQAHAAEEPPAPGWYDDPLSDGEYQRHWDGQWWGDTTKPRGGPSAQFGMVPPGSPVERSKAKRRTASSQMLVTGTDYVPGFEVVKLFPLVHGSAVVATGMIKDLQAFARDTFVGGHSKAYRGVLDEALDAATADLRIHASAAADAVLSVRFEVAQLGSEMIAVVASGTPAQLAEAASAPRSESDSSAR